MNDLAQFLRARLDEDERIARRACEAAQASWRLGEGYDDETVLWWPPEPRVAQKERELGLPVVSDVWRGQTIYGDGQGIAPHIARHDPARVLAEVDGKRRIVAYAEQRAAIKQGEDDSDWENIQEMALDAVLRSLALAYATHPDYRDTWRP